MKPETSAPPPFAAKEAILAALRERILSFAASRLGRDRAEDVVQEVMLLLHEKYGHLQRLEDLLPLSLQILRFKMAGAQRKSWRRGEDGQLQVEELPLPSPEADPEMQLARAERTEQLLRAVRELCPRCRELLRLKLEGKGYEEIREILGARTVATVYTWDFRCRKQLMERLGGRWGGRR